MSETSPSPRVTESATPQPKVAPLVKPDLENDFKEVRRRFRRSGTGVASRTLLPAILEFLQRGK